MADTTKKESRLARCADRQTLIDYAQGASQRLVETTLANFIAPTVEVGTTIGHYKEYSAKSQYRIPTTKRPVHGRAAMIGWDLCDKTFNCQPHALDCQIDLAEAGDDETFGILFKDAADLVAESAALDFEAEVMETALSALSPVELEVSDSTNLIKAMDEKVDALIKKTGLGASLNVRIVFGSSAWTTFKNHKSVQNALGVSSRAYLVPNVADITGLILGNPEARVSYALKDTAPEGLARNLDYLMGSKILIFVGNNNPTRRDPSFMKTFRLAKRWMVAGSYFAPDRRCEVAKMDWSQDVKVTNADAAFLIDLK